MLDTLTHPKQRAFLLAFCSLGQITAAAEAAGCSREAHYDWLNTDEAYRAAFAIAQTIAGDALEDIARKRAYEGSDKLLMFLLKGLKPDVYGTKKVEHSGPGGAPVAVTIKFID